MERSLSVWEVESLGFAVFWMRTILQPASRSGGFTPYRCGENREEKPGLPVRPVGVVAQPGSPEPTTPSFDWSIGELVILVPISPLTSARGTISTPNR